MAVTALSAGADWSWGCVAYMYVLTLAKLCGCRRYSLSSCSTRRELSCGGPPTEVIGHPGYSDLFKAGIVTTWASFNCARQSFGGGS